MAEKVYVVLDLETTGLSVDKHEMLQVSGVKFNESFNIIETFNEYIRCGYVSDFILNFIGVDREFLEDNAKFKPDVIHGFNYFLRNADVLVGHNIKNFDLKFLEKNGFDVNSFEVIDTLHYSRKVNKHLPSHKLDFLVNHYNIENKFGRTHSSINDCFYEMEIFYNLQKELPVEEFLKLPTKPTYTKFKPYVKVERNLVQVDVETCVMLSGKNVCFSGRFNNLDKQHLIENLDKISAKLHANITKTTDVLIYVGENTQKVQKARDNGIEVYSQEQFIKMVNN